MSLIRDSKSLTECAGEMARYSNRGRTNEDEIQFLTKANLTPRNVARFSHVGRQRSLGAPLFLDVAPCLRDEQRASDAFTGRPASEHALQVQRCFPGSAKAW